VAKTNVITVREVPSEFLTNLQDNVIAPFSEDNASFKEFHALPGGKRRETDDYQMPGRMRQQCYKGRQANGTEPKRFAAEND